MKRIFTIIACLAYSIAFGQKTVATFSNPNYVPAPYHQAGQMLNIANSYAYLNVSPFIGGYNDTITTSSSAKTIYLYTAVAGTPTVAVDTFVPYPVYGYGTISFMVTGIKISGTPTGTVTLQKSVDGINWTPIRASATIGQDTLTIANVATQQAYTWDIDIKKMPYYRIAIVVPSSTQSTSWQGWYFFTKQYFIKS